MDLSDHPARAPAILQITLDALRLCLVLLLATAYLPVMSEIPEIPVVKEEGKENDNANTNGKKAPIRRSYGPRRIFAIRGLFTRILT